MRHHLGFVGAVGIGSKQLIAALEGIKLTGHRLGRALVTDRIQDVLDCPCFCQNRRNRVDDQIETSPVQILGRKDRGAPTLDHIRHPGSTDREPDIVKPRKRMRRFDEHGSETNRQSRRAASAISV